MVYCKCCSKGFNWWLLGRMCAHLHPCWISSQYFCVYSVILKALPMRWLLRYNNKTSICSFLVPFCTYIIFFVQYTVYTYAIPPFVPHSGWKLTDSEGLAPVTGE